MITQEREKASNTPEEENVQRHYLGFCRAFDNSNFLSLINIIFENIECGVDRVLFGEHITLNEDEWTNFYKDLEIILSVKYYTEEDAKETRMVGVFELVQYETPDCKNSIGVNIKDNLEHIVHEGKVNSIQNIKSEILKCLREKLSMLLMDTETKEKYNTIRFCLTKEKEGELFGKMYCYGAKYVYTDFEEKRRQFVLKAKKDYLEGVSKGIKLTEQQIAELEDPRR